MKIFETKHDEATTKLLEQEPLLKDKNINSNEARSYDRRTLSIQRALRQLRGDLHKLRRESGRLEAWLRKKSGNQSRGRRDGRKGNQRKPMGMVEQRVEDILAACFYSKGNQ